MGSTKKRMLFTEAIGRESQSNEFPELETFKVAAEELLEYLPHIYHPIIDNEREKSYQKVKHEHLHMTTKANVKLKETILQIGFR